jgi:hypothetical protein
MRRRSSTKASNEGAERGGFCGSREVVTSIAARSAVKPALAEGRPVRVDHIEAVG